ncbi:SulP family inorganic anion transporter [Aquipuribacter nitratireducens]|uniref:SulP family inorganic anion transporter n=1 Tax=Aquipuribacter nitratireducens TaxID=650104 RepID=A0ABW0GNZ6_9MICO
MTDARSGRPRGPLFPGLVAARSYRRSWLRADVLAGVTVAAYLIPQVMAYASGVAGLPAVVGLWAIMGPLAVYALLGSSRQLSVGPESTTALMTAVAVAPLALGDTGRYAALAALLALAVGVLCLAAFVARLGFLADLLSKPVLTGYLAGIAVVMILGQLGTLTGVPVDGDTVVAQVTSFVSGLDQTVTATLVLGLAVLVLLLAAQRVFPRAPGPLMAVLAATAVSVAFDLESAGLAVVGDIPAGFPTLGTPDVAWSDVRHVLLAAVGVTIVAYSDNVLTGRAFGSRNGYRIDPNQELLALGAANLSAGVSQGFPVSSSGSRTAIGDALGSRTQLYSLVALASVVVVLLFLRPVLAQFPTAALAAIVVYAALRLVDVHEFRRLAAFRRSELVLALATTAGVLVFDILYGVLVAVGLSVLDLLRRVARPHDGILGYVPGLAGMHDIDDYPTAVQVPGLVVYRYDSQLFFANAEDFRRRALDAVDAAEGPVEWFVLNAEANVEVDITSVDALDELVAELKARGVHFAMARVKQDLRRYLTSSGFVDRIGPDRIFSTLPTAVQAYLRWYETEHGRPLPDVSGLSPTVNPVLPPRAPADAPPPDVPDVSDHDAGMT